MKQEIFTVRENTRIAENTMEIVLHGDASALERPGQFVNVKIDGFFLRRPLSVCFASETNITLIYRIVGAGTEKLAAASEGDTFDILTGLGNGFDLSRSGDRPLLLGGGMGTAPLYWLCSRLTEQGKHPRVILGFPKAADVFYKEEFEALGAETVVVTEDGSLGEKGFVTRAMPDAEYTYFYACGPEPMLKAVCRASVTPGEMSFSTRMGCGFGACMGCTCQTLAGPKRICKDGPVMKKEEIRWED